MSFAIDTIPALTDNYIFVVSDTELGLAMVVDPSDSIPVREFLQKRDLHLALILNTHHHQDHIAGNVALSHEYGAPIIGPGKEKHYINNLSRGVWHGETVTFSDLRGWVVDTSGHTVGHVSYYFPQLKALFCGDALFSLGCGRLFEGTATEMWESMKTIRAFPDDTSVYCGHEYTLANADFALAIDQNHPELRQYVDSAAKLRRAGKPTVPSLLGKEKQLNPFLRADDRSFIASLRKDGFYAQDGDPSAIFGALRAAKDRFDASAEN